MQAAQGIAETPAHRGTVYVTFDDYDITEHGRPPQVKAEIAFKADRSPGFQKSIDGPDDGYSSPPLMDWTRDRIIHKNDDAGEGGGFRTFSASTMIEGTAQDFADIGIPTGGSFGATTPVRVGKWSGIIFAHAATANQEPLHFIDPDTLTWLGTFGSQNALPGLGIHGGPGTMALSERFQECIIVAPPQTGLVVPEQRIVMGWSVLAGRFIMLDFSDATAPKMLSWGGAPTTETNFQRGSTATTPRIGVNALYSLANASNGTSAYVTKYEFTYGCYYDPDANTVYGVTAQTLVEFPSTTWTDLGATTTVGGPMLDETDGNLLFWAGGGNDDLVLWKYNLGTNAIQWANHYDARDVQTPNVGTYNQSSRIRNGEIGFIGNNNQGWMVIDTITGELKDHGDNSTDFPGIRGQYSGHYFWDDTYRCFWAEASNVFGNSLERMCVGRERGLGEPLNEVVNTLSGTLVNGAKLPASQYNTGQLASDTVEGSAIMRHGSIRSYIENDLMPIYEFDSAVIDGQVVFVKRSVTSTFNIAEDDLVAANPLIEEQRTMELDLPRRIELKFIDRALDYEDNSAPAQRSALPIATMLSDSESEIEVPIVLTASQAKEIAERLLHTAWSQRVTFSFTVPHEYYKLAPTNIGTLNLNSGTSILFRIVALEHMPNHTIKVTCTAVDTSLAISAGAVADASVSFEAQTVNQSFNTRLFLFDGPYLRDLDATQRASIELRYSMSGRLPGWSAGTLYQSPDNAIYTDVGRVIGGTAYGIIQNKLPAGTDTELTDVTTTLVVKMIQGTLSSTTEAGYYENNNVAAIGLETGSKYENIIFRDAVLQSNDTYHVSHIGRGRRGTDSEFFTENHVNGEMFVVLDRSTTERLTLPLGDLSTTKYYKGVGDAEFIESVPIRALASTGGPLKPLKPSYLDLAVDSSNNIDINWIRSTRLNYENAQDWNTKLLNEDTEEYELDILDETGAVARAVTGLTAAVNAVTTIDIGSSTTFTQASGSFITDGFFAGMKIHTRNFPIAANNGVFTVSTVAALTLTIVESTLVVDLGEGNESIYGTAYEYSKANMITDIGVSNATAQIDVGSSTTFTQATGSFITDGFVAGMKIETANFTAGANNGIFTVNTVAALTLTVDETTLVTETGTGDETVTGIRRPDWTTKIYQISAQVGRGYASDDTLLPT
jgi:hypothetical protein